MNKELKQHLILALDKQVRYDGRKDKLAYRDIKVKTGISVNAEGSAEVTLGKTRVYAGVKMAIEEPFPDKPDNGMLMVGAELLPLSNPNFESGPPGIWATEIARVVDRGIRESGLIDLPTLCLEPGKKVWAVLIDIVTINDEGNLLDAAALAVYAALQNTVFPKFDGETVEYGVKTDKKLPLNDKKPIAVTVYKVANHFFVDPNTDEEKAYDARLTVVTSDDNTICAMQKGGETPLTQKEVEDMVGIAMDKGKELRKLV
ncbi:MAG: exosome complex protein Rrp42 [Nanoarchaeota archaeon]|nr:exosome complex protein Rrp42 [Nanoarchaeota archaeon]